MFVIRGGRKRMISSIDVELLRALNVFVVPNHKFLWNLTNNPVLRGFPIFFPLVALWFHGACKNRYRRMLIGLFAACVALCCRFYCSFILVPTYARFWINRFM